MSIGPTATPPGWYPDPTGTPMQRWWDGTAWAEATRPSQPAPVVYAPPPQYGPPPRSPVAYYPPPAPRNGAATAGLVLGIICLFVNSFLLVSIPAFICSIVGLTKASQLEAAGFGGVGRASAVWGLVLSIVGAIATIFFKFLLF